MLRNIQILPVQLHKVSLPSLPLIRNMTTEFNHGATGTPAYTTRVFTGGLVLVRA